MPNDSTSIVFTLVIGLVLFFSVPCKANPYMVPDAARHQCEYFGTVASMASYMSQQGVSKADLKSNLKPAKHSAVGLRMITLAKLAVDYAYLHPNVTNLVMIHDMAKATCLSEYIPMKRANHE